MRIFTFGNILILLIITFLYMGFLYFQGKQNNTDYFSLGEINEYYSLSSKGVSYEGKLIPRADKSSFEALDIPYYGKDKDHVFWSATEIYHADPKSFVMINYLYSKDRDRVFFRGKPLLQADPNTFSIIEHQYQFTDGDYSKDQSRVYLDHYIIPHADPETFELFNWDWAKDKNYVYYKGRLLPEIDSQSFVPIHYMAKDKDHPYNKGDFIAGIDGSTFEELPPGRYYRDKNYVYVSGSVDTIFYGENEMPIAPKDFIYVENYDEETGRDYSYYKAPGDFCFDESNGMRIRCE